LCFEIFLRSAAFTPLQRAYDFQPSSGINAALRNHDPTCGRDSLPPRSPAARIPEGERLSFAIPDAVEQIADRPATPARPATMPRRDDERGVIHCRRLRQQIGRNHEVCIWKDIHKRINFRRRDLRSEQIGFDNLPLLRILHVGPRKKSARACSRPCIESVSASRAVSAVVGSLMTSRSSARKEAWATAGLSGCRIKSVKAGIKLLPPR